MSKTILNELEALVRAQVISEETAQHIRRYYAHKPNAATTRLFIVFGILGALLTGMGIILIIAHNWDTLGKVAKISIALTPLLMGQLICAYVLLQKNDHVAWRESSAAFLVLAIASAIAIVSQVYHIEGSLAGFLWIWMALSLPVIYVMRSSIASLLYIAGITAYACEVSYFSRNESIAWWYWAFLALVFPFYLWLLKQQNRSNFFYFHSWLITLSLITTLGMFTKDTGELMIIAYVNVLGMLIAIGQIKPFSENRLGTNAPLVVGSLGTIGLLLTLSFEWFWKEINQLSFEQWRNTPEYYTCIVTTLLTCFFLIWVMKVKPLRDINVKSFAFMVVIVLFLFGQVQPITAQIMMNVLIFFAGVFTIRDGARQDRLGVLNYGLLILTALILCRFFDMHIPFVLRGLMFVAVGIGFFVANYQMIKKRKAQTSQAQ